MKQEVPAIAVISLTLILIDLTIALLIILILLYCADYLDDLTVCTSLSYNDCFFDFMTTLPAAKFTGAKQCH